MNYVYSIITCIFEYIHNSSLNIHNSFTNIHNFLSMFMIIVCRLLILCCDWSVHVHMSTLQNGYWGAILLSNTQTQSCQVHVLTSLLGTHEKEPSISEWRKGTKKSLGFL